MSVPSGPSPTYRCHVCAATFTAWAPAQRHADAEHHHRIEVIVHPEDKEPRCARPQ
jgi:hypothetical protein